MLVNQLTRGSKMTVAEVTWWSQAVDVTYLSRRRWLGVVTPRGMTAAGDLTVISSAIRQLAD